MKRPDNVDIVGWAIMIPMIALLWVVIGASIKYIWMVGF